MSDAPTPAAGATTTPQTGGSTASQEGFKPITTQGDLDKLVGERLGRERAKYPDYDKYKAAAEKLAQIEEASKTELERAIARAEKAEAKALGYENQAKLEAHKQEVAKETGIPSAVLEGATKEAITAHAERLKPYFKKGAAPVVPRDGDQPPVPGATGDPRAIPTNAGSTCKGLCITAFEWDHPRICWEHFLLHRFGNVALVTRCPVLPGCRRGNPGLRHPQHFKFGR
jgi:hypothetical protein